MSPGAPGQGDECVFCQLMENPQQLKLVEETENFYAWLEYPEPRAKGQTNIVPKEHKESVMELSPEEYHEAMGLVREIMEKAVKGLGADGVSVIMNIKEAAGQMLPHVYIQVFPRYEEDERAGTPAGALFQHVEELQGNDEKFKEIQDQMSSVDIDFGVETKEPHPESQNHKEVEEKEEAKGKEEDSREKRKKRRDRSIEWV